VKETAVREGTVYIQLFNTFLRVKYLDFLISECIRGVRTLVVAMMMLMGFSRYVRTPVVSGEDPIAPHSIRPRDTNMNHILPPEAFDILWSSFESPKY